MLQSRRHFGRRSEIFLFLFIALTVFCCGCKKKKGIPIVPYNQNNRTENELQPIMKTEKGFYYSICYKRGLGIHFIDSKSKSDIFLCGKPECAHDGSEFCTATNKKYFCIQSVLYGDKIYSFVNEKRNDSDTVFKIIANSLDGTVLNEIATVLTFTGDSIGFTVTDEMLAHNGKLYINFHLMLSDSDLGRVTKSGIAEVDLTTGKSKVIEEVETASSGEGISGMNANGDYLFFIRKEPKKKRVVRYQLSTGERQEVKLFLSTSKTVFSVLDENRIFFSKDCKSLEIYDFSTEERKEVPIEFHPVQLQEWESEEFFIPYLVNSFTNYKDYIIVAEDKAFLEEGEKAKRYYHIYTMDGTEICYFQRPEEIENIFYQNEIGLSILDDEVFFQDKEKVLFCTFDNLLQGKEDFEVAYTYETKRTFLNREILYE